MTHAALQLLSAILLVACLSVLGSHDGSEPSTDLPSLWIVMPFTVYDLDRLEYNIERWHAATPPCRKGAPPLAELSLYFHRNLEDEAYGDTRKTVQGLLDGIEGAPWRECFTSVSIMNANLTDENDIYVRDIDATGPNSMFYAVFVPGGTGDRRAPYAFWMEPDVIPIQRYWLEKLYCNVYSELCTICSVEDEPTLCLPHDSLTESTQSIRSALNSHDERIISLLPAHRFWMRGSMFFGNHTFDDHRWNHINGNAVYALYSTSFRTWLRDRVRPQYPLDPFDAAMHYANHENVQSHFPELSTNSHRFQKTDMIRSYGNTPFNVSEILESSPGTVFVHGTMFFRDDFSEDGVDWDGYSGNSSMCPAAIPHCKVYNPFVLLRKIQEKADSFIFQLQALFARGQRRSPRARGKTRNRTFSMRPDFDAEVSTATAKVRAVWADLNAFQEAVYSARDASKRYSQDVLRAGGVHAVWHLQTAAKPVESFRQFERAVQDVQKRWKRMQSNIVWLEDRLHTVSSFYKTFVQLHGDMTHAEALIFGNSPTSSGDTATIGVKDEL